MRALSIFALILASATQTSALPPDGKVLLYCHVDGFWPAPFYYFQCPIVKQRSVLGRPPWYCSCNTSHGWWGVVPGRKAVYDPRLDLLGTVRSSSQVQACGDCAYKPASKFSNIRYWHKADMPLAWINVRFRE